MMKFVNRVLDTEDIGSTGIRVRSFSRQVVIVVVKSMCGVRDLGHCTPVCRK